MLSALLVASMLAAAPDWEPTGEVSFHVRGSPSTGASFDGERLVGPTANLTKTGDGWAGDIGGQNVNLEISPKRIVGSSVDLHLEADKGKTSIRGTFFGRQLTLQYDHKSVSGRVGACSFQLDRKGTGDFEGTVGCMQRRGPLPQTGYGVLKLYGQAAEDSPPSPQFPLALVAVLVS
jgi:hypothetical protein